MIVELPSHGALDRESCLRGIGVKSAGPGGTVARGRGASPSVSYLIQNIPKISENISYDGVLHGNRKLQGRRNNEIGVERRGGPGGKSVFHTHGDSATERGSDEGGFDRVYRCGI